MADKELNHEEDQKFPEEGSIARVTELEKMLAEKDRRIGLADARIDELTQAVAARDGEITNLKQSMAELDERMTTVNNSLSETVASYKTMVVQTNPEVIEELISGDSVESINESLSKAKALVSRVREGLETEISLARVPVGAPERRPSDLSSLSSREKIQYALGSKK